MKWFTRFADDLLARMFSTEYNLQKRVDKAKKKAATKIARGIE